MIRRDLALVFAVLVLTCAGYPFALSEDAPHIVEHPKH